MRPDGSRRRLKRTNGEVVVQRGEKSPTDKLRGLRLSVPPTRVLVGQGLFQLAQAANLEVQLEDARKLRLELFERQIHFFAVLIFEFFALFGRKL